MAIPVRCECGAVFEVRDEYAGKKGLCPTCGAQVVIPQPSAPQPGGMTPPKFRGRPTPPAPPEDIYEEQEVEDDQHARRTMSWAGLGSGFLGLNRTAGILLLFVGLSLVVISRGCDSTGNRSVARAAAQYQQAQHEFEDEWDEKRLPVETKLTELRQELEKTEQELRDERGKAESNQATIDKLQSRVQDYEQDIKARTTELAKLKTDRAKEHARVSREEWHDYEVALRDAATGQRKTGWWLSWLFLGGTLLLVPGLLALVATGEGQEKLISMVMLAIILFSIYVGGAAWIDTMFSSVDSQTVRERATRVIQPPQRFDRPAE